MMGGLTVEQERRMTMGGCGWERGMEKRYAGPKSEKTQSVVLTPLGGCTGKTIKQR